jgi:hypothetical protein
MSDQMKSMTEAERRAEVAERLMADDCRLLHALIMVAFRKASIEAAKAARKRRGK